MRPSIFNRISIFSPLSSLKNLIHPPLPLTASESQKLLSLLKTSFRDQLATSSNGPISAASHIEPAFSSRGDAHFAQVLKNPAFSVKTASESTVIQQERAGRFLLNPLQVYREYVTEGLVSPQLAISTLQRHTANMLKVPSADREYDWAVQAVLEVIKPFRDLSPTAHIEEKALRRKIINTLVLGDKVEVASGILFKPWLLHISNQQEDAEKLLEIRHSIVKEVMQAVEEFLGLEAATREFLKMVEMWKQKNGDDFQHSPSSPTRSHSSAPISHVQSRSRTPLNPFLTNAQNFLLRYAHQRNPEVLALRSQLLSTCRPWIRGSLARTRLKLYYENNPYPLYRFIMGHGEKLKPDQCSRACFELILALVHRSEWEDANEVLQFMRHTLFNDVSGLELSMVEEIEEMLRSPELDILKTLTDKLDRSVRWHQDGQFFEFWKQLTPTL